MCNIVVMERCDRGCLWGAVRQSNLLHRALPDGRRRVNLRILYSVLCDVAAGLAHMHSSGLCHCDVKAENVMLCSTSGPVGVVAKVGDLGLVRLLGEDGVARNTDTSGTLTHLAPERFRAGGLVSAAVDVYAFGILMAVSYELHVPTKRKSVGQLISIGVEGGVGLLVIDTDPNPVCCTHLEP
jgi:serine/threonine protein kinase